MNEFALIAGMSIVTFLIRYPTLALVGKIPLPETILSALKYVPIAVLTAIITPEVLMPEGGGLQIGLENAYLVAGIIAILVSWRTKNLLLTIIVGMASLWLWRALLGTF